MPTKKEVFTISELAQEFEISTRTIRYYEEADLIKPLERKDGEQRLYNRKARVRLKLILRGKKFGFSLSEIKEMIDLYDVNPTEKEQLQRTLEYGDKKIMEIDEKIEDLKILKEDILKIRQKLIRKITDNRP
ncbi:MAG: MerR family DNA-binding transcriptional regulator [Firmicutes bacterium]|nr:MerR family DNA-binding transcriptional regulator [Bacillota bacterium]